MKNKNLDNGKKREVVFLLPLILGLSTNGIRFKVSDPTILTMSHDMN